MSNSNAARLSAVPQISRTSLTRTARMAEIAHLWLNRALLAGIALQFYTVGLAAVGVDGFIAHAVLGWTMLIVAGLSLATAAVSRQSTKGLLLPAAVLALVIAQPLLALVSKSAFPMIYALHGANAVILLALAFRTDRVAVRARREGTL
jgi:hypothetical protein